jgi:hypothetical protein
MPVVVSEEKVRLGEMAEPFPVKTAMVAKLVKVFGFHFLPEAEKRKEEKALAFYLLHEKTERLSGFVVFEAEVLGLFHYRPIAAVVGEVKVAGVDVREAKRRAADIPGVVRVGQDVAAKIVLPGRVQIDRGCGALNNVSTNCSECHFSKKVKSESEKLLPKRI